MATFVMIATHSPTDCAMHNEKSAKIVADWMRKTPELEAKHGVKPVGSWVVPTEHLTLLVFEAPSAEAAQAYMMEPEAIAMSYWQTMEVKPAITMEEMMQMMQQIKP